MISKPVFIAALGCTALAVAGLVQYQRGRAEVAALRAQIAPRPAEPSLGAVRPAPTPVEIRPAVAPPDEEEPPVVQLTRAVATLRASPEGLDRLLVEAAKPESKGITYAHLQKNADRYMGHAWTARGRILEIHENGNYTKGRLTLSDYVEQVLFFLIPNQGETDFVSGDVVEVLGVLAGTESYTSQAGWNITIPAILVHTMAKQGALRRSTRRPSPPPAQ